MIRQRSYLGFSLIELLLAIFILGIGIISIATLFPAGIAQQQKTRDDVLGPIVARNALTLLRSRLDREDFGGAEDFDAGWSPDLCGLTGTDSGFNLWPTICGDWMWRRPAVFPMDYGQDSDPLTIPLRGAIDIFATPETEGIEGEGPPIVEYYSLESDPVPPGIPYNRTRYADNLNQGQFVSLNVPTIRIFASERQYPMWSGDPAERPEGQYYWECMFRRYEGRILVAIFVFRVVDATQNSTYLMDTSQMAVPSFPRHANLALESSAGSWNAVTGGEVLNGTEDDDPSQPQQQWQIPGQWIVDQNGNVHTVQKGRRRSGTTIPVRLHARPSEVPAFTNITQPTNPTANVNWWDKSATPSPPPTPVRPTLDD